MSSAAHGMEIQLYQGQEGSPNESSAMKRSRKQRSLQTSEVLGTKEVFFRVFKFPADGEEYLLEMHQVGTGAIDRYRLTLARDKKDVRKWTVEIYDLETGQHVVFPVTEDPNPPKFQKKYQLSLQERLHGWTLEKRIRVNTKKEETFYRHWSRTFRSFLEVSGFILYACEPRDLQAVGEWGQDVQPLMQISFDNVEGGNTSTSQT